MKIFCLIASFFFFSFTAAAAEPGESAAKIFISFAQKNVDILTYNKDFGSDWEDKVFIASKKLSKDEASQLLSYLENRIGKEVLSERIKDLSSFKESPLDLEKFLGRISFYEHFLGQEEVTKHLKKFLGGFYFGDLMKKEARKTYLQNLVGPRNLDLMTNSGIASLKGINPSSEEAVYKIAIIFEYIKGVVGEKPAKTLIKENFKDIMEASNKEGKNILKEKIEYIKTYIDSVKKAYVNSGKKEAAQKAILIDIITLDFKSFISLDLKEFEKIRLYLTSSLGLEDQNILSMMRRGIGAFSKAKLSHIEEVLKYIESEIHLMKEKEEVKIKITSNLVYKNPKILSDVDLNDIKNTFSYLKDYMKKRKPVQSMKKRSSIFYNMDFYELTKATVFLENLLGKETVHSIIINEGESLFNLRQIEVELIVNWMKSLDKDFLFLKERAAQKEFISFFKYINGYELEKIKYDDQKQKILDRYLRIKSGKECAKAF